MTTSLSKNQVHPVFKQVRTPTDYAMLAAIIDSSEDAIISKTLDGTLTSWNPAAERIFGYTANEVIGRSILMLLPPDRLEEEAAILSKLRKGIRVEHLETVRLHKSGGEIQVSVTSSPVTDTEGEIVGASKIVRDISAQKKAENVMRWQQSAMEHMARLNTMGELATGLAHELNQPLCSILTYAGTSLELIRSGKNAPQWIAAGLQEVISETNRAGEIIRRLRNFIRKRETSCELVDVNALIRDSLHLQEHDLSQANIHICLNLAMNLPAASADPVQLVQVLVNLIRNARDAMLHLHAGERELTVISSKDNDDDEIRIDIVDRGCGVTDEQMHRLFDRFFSTKANGLGMGLAISKTIVTSLGGRLNASANPNGVGMTFSISLPGQKQGER